MDTDSIMLLVVLGVLVLLSAFFSSAETAVLSVNKVRMMDIAEEGNKKAKLVLALFRSAEQTDLYAFGRQ